MNWRSWKWKHRKHRKHGKHRKHRTLLKKNKETFIHMVGGYLIQAYKDDKWSWINKNEKKVNCPRNISIPTRTMWGVLIIFIKKSVYIWDWYARRLQVRNSSVILSQFLTSFLLSGRINWGFSKELVSCCSKWNLFKSTTCSWNFASSANWNSMLSRAEPFLNFLNW